jgi:hypothetical protein
VAQGLSLSNGKAPDILRQIFMLSDHRNETRFQR